jgi:hypothetical protein
LLLPPDAISLVHCTLEKHESQCALSFVGNLGKVVIKSTDGTNVQLDNRNTGPVFLRSGDRLSFSAEVFLVYGLYQASLFLTSSSSTRWVLERGRFGRLTNAEKSA